MIYLDNNATTRVLPEVMNAMLPFYTELWGNPSSLHQFGAQIVTHIDRAREQVAGLIGAQRANEITFTSGGTESNHLAIRGVLAANPANRHLITTSVEHPSVLTLAQKLEQEGYKITYLAVDKNGEPNLDQLEKAFCKETALVSILWANNETGIISPIEKISKICVAKNIPLHVDAIQATGKIPIDVKQIKVDLLSLSGHKLHAPKGIGALYIRRGTKWEPSIFGGHQERGRRAGTENVGGMIGLGMAAELARLRIKENGWKKIEGLRNQMEQNLLTQFSEIKINGKQTHRLPNTSSLSFENLSGETICLLLNESGIAASTGSACSAGSLEPSHVLNAMGLNHKQAKGTIRLSLSVETTPQEIEAATLALSKIISRLSK